jgi:hypothetical protein
VVDTTQLVNVTIKTLKFSEKICAGEVAVNDAYRIVGVECGYQLISGGFDGLHMAGCNVTGSAD